MYNNNIFNQHQTNIEKILLDNKSIEETITEIDLEIKNGGSIYEPLNENGDFIFHILVNVLQII